MCMPMRMQALLAYGPALSSYNPRDVSLAMEVAATHQSTPQRRSPRAAADSDD